MNPMKFGFVGALGGIFTFIGKLFVSATCGVAMYFALDADSELSDKLHTKLFPVFVCIAIGYIISNLFFLIYGVASDAVLLCFFW